MQLANFLGAFYPDAIRAGKSSLTQNIYSMSPANSVRAPYESVRSAPPEANSDAFLIDLGNTARMHPGRQ